MPAIPLNGARYPSARPIAPISTARTASPADAPIRPRPRTAVRPPDRNARLTPASNTKVAAARPPASTCTSVGLPSSPIVSKAWVAIIPTSARPRATSTPITRGLPPTAPELALVARSADGATGRSSTDDTDDTDVASPQPSQQHGRHLLSPR